MKLTQYDGMPEGLLQRAAHELVDILPGPSLIHIQGKRRNPVFVSALLHGNEDVGWRAVQALLARYREQLLPRDLSVFIGNVAAASQHKRRLDGQVDYNRVWPGSDEHLDADEFQIMRQVVDEMRGRHPFVSIDLHNNTGLNPHYACVNRLDHSFLHVATLFSRTVIYFLQPRGVQSIAFSEMCPSVTCECGRVGDERGVLHASDFINACLHLNAIPSHRVSSHDIDLYHTVATVKIPQDISFSFNNDKADIRFDVQLDRLNFCEVKAGTMLARIRPGKQRYLDVANEEGQDVYSRYFSIDGEELRFVTSLMPSMLTLDEAVIRQDCLCYLMERYAIELRR